MQRLSQVFVPEASEYVEGLRKKKLLIMKCSKCNNFRLPHSVACSYCSSFEYTWQEASGEGTIYSYVTFHRAFHDSVESLLPYIVAKIKLEEGIFFISNVIGSLGELVCGTEVTLVWERLNDGSFLPQFKKK